MKKLFACLMAFVLVTSGCYVSNKEELERQHAEQMAVLEGPEEKLSGPHHAEIRIKDYGTVTVELDADAAPITVTNFVDLAKKGFYDGTTFHRIMDGFVVQGGAPRTDWSEEVHKIKGEFSDNGVDNPLVHTEGVLSMARSSDSYNSASSQFFIMVGDYPHLDGQYAAFGHVTDGYEIVQKIAADAKPTDSNGTIKPEEQPVIESVVILD